MLGVSIVLFVVLLAVLFAVAAVTAGFGDLMKPVFQDARPVGLPEERVAPGDLDDLRFNVVLRGYKMAEVDAVLHRLARELAERDAVLAELRGETSYHRGIAVPPLEPPAPYEPPASYVPLAPYDAPTELLAPLADEPAPYEAQTELLSPVVDEPAVDLDPRDPGFFPDANLDETQGFPVYEAPPLPHDPPPEAGPATGM